MLRQPPKQKPINEVPRRTGRPHQQASEALVRHIVETAARLFIEKGYVVSMDQIASAAGAGKQTIYRRFGSKEALFLAVVDRQVQRLAETARFEEAKDANPIEALKESCCYLLDSMLNPDMIRLQRILVAEAGRFPNIGEYFENCMAPFAAVLQRLLWSATTSGRLRKLSPEQLVTHLIGAIAGWPVRQAMLGIDPFPGPEAREVHFEAAWDLFLNGAAWRAGGRGEPLERTSGYS
jgi:AcrR family transcriptional regulator